MPEIIEFENKYSDDYLNVYNRAFADSAYSRIGWIQKKSEVKKDYDRIFLAVEGGRVIGEVTLSIGSYGPDEVCIDSVAVLPEFRNKGIGSELVKKAEDYAFEAGKKAVCEILDSCDELLVFYQKRGFMLKYLRYRVETGSGLFKFIDIRQVNEIKEPILKLRTWIMLEKKAEGV